MIRDLDRAQCDFYSEPSQKTLDKLKDTAYYYCMVHIIPKSLRDHIIKSADKYLKEYQNEQQ